MNLSAIKRQAVPLHAEVAALLRNKIFSGTLAAGAQLPPLRELTEEMGIARMTVRQAMDALEEEGLIERFAGRGTFVRDVALPKRQTLHMKAGLSQLQAMAAELEVSVMEGESFEEEGADGAVSYRAMKRVHALDGKPFCRVDLRLESALYKLAPDRFSKEIVIRVLQELGIETASARQRVAISYADLEIAQALDTPVNSPVFRVFREFFDASGKLIYSASLTYPGDMLELEIEFSVDG